MKGLLALAQWAKDNKLPKQADDTYERVLKFEPDNVDAHLGLGYERVNGKWLRGEDLQKAKGLVEYQGQWVTPEVKGLLEQGYVKRGDRWVTKEEAQCIDEGKPYHPGGDAPAAPAAEPVEKPAKPQKAEKPPKADAPKAEAPAPKADPRPAAEPAAPKAAPIELPADDKELMKIVTSSTKKPEERAEAVKALAAKGDTQKAALAQELTNLVAAARKAIIDHFKSEKNAIRAKMAALVADRRHAALVFIFDRSKYPDEDHGKVGQPEVDRLVGELRRAWADPLRELAQDKTEKKLNDKLAELWRVGGWLRDPVGQSFDPTAVEDEIAREASSLIATFDNGIDPADAQQLEASKAVMKFNQTYKSTLTTEERECVNATNEYRMMFGLAALKVHEGLVQAARKHAKEMVEKNYFDHSSPVPENATPQMRCAAEGVRYTGENIAMGSTSGRQTWHQWYTSSGHHRNMLMRHKSIGVGAETNYWTQDFGATEPN